MISVLRHGCGRGALLAAGAACFLAAPLPPPPYTAAQASAGDPASSVQSHAVHSRGRGQVLSKTARTSHHRAFEVRNRVGSTEQQVTRSRLVVNSVGQRGQRTALTHRTRKLWQQPDT